MRLRLGRAAEQRFGRVQRGHQAGLVDRRQALQQRADFLPRCRIDCGEQGLAAFGERKDHLPPVNRRGLAADQVAIVEAAQDTAEVALVEVQLAGEFRGGGGCAAAQLVNHPPFGQRQRTAEQPFMQQADPARVEPAEASDRVGVG